MTRPSEINDLERELEKAARSQVGLILGLRSIPMQFARNPIVRRAVAALSASESFGRELVLRFEELANDPGLDRGVRDYKLASILYLVANQHRHLTAGLLMTVVQLADPYLSLTNAMARQVALWPNARTEWQVQTGRDSALDATGAVSPSPSSKVEVGGM